MNKAKMELLDYFYNKGAYRWSDSSGEENASILSAMDTLKYIRNVFNTTSMFMWAECVPANARKKANRFIFDFRFEDVISIPITEVHGWGRVPVLSLSELLDFMAINNTLEHACIVEKVPSPNPIPLSQEQLGYLTTVKVPKRISPLKPKEFVQHKFTNDRWSAVCIAGMWYFGTSVDNAKPYLTDAEIAEINREIVKSRL